LTKPDNDSENFEEGLQKVKKIDIDTLKDTLDKIPAIEKAAEIIENACSYEEITVARQGAIENHYNNQKLKELENLSKQREEISKQLAIERIILVSSLLAGLLMIVLLIYSFKIQKKLRSANRKSKLLNN